MSIDSNKMVLRFEMAVPREETIYLSDEDYAEYLENLALSGETGYTGEAGYTGETGE